MRGTPEPGAVVAGHRLVRRLGQGSQSEVFLAERLSDGAAIALKLCPLADTGTQARAFLHAAMLAQQLVHPHIVAVQGAGIEGRTAWLAMEPVAGSDLTRYTRPPRLLPEAVVLGIVRRVAGALAHAHQHGVVHRDLKPANVLVDLAQDVVKLSDFGLARDGDGSHTATGVVPGTPAYMPPEQLAGATPDAACDLYALGVVLFELLAGRRPHQAESMGELLRQVAQEPAPSLQSVRPDLPAPLLPGLADLLDQLLAKRPVDRPRDAMAVATVLGTLQQRLPGPV